MTTKVKIIKQVETEVEMEFPVYKNWNGNSYQITSANSCICVKNDGACTSQRAFGIDVMRGYSNSVGLYISEGEDITKEEFEKNLSLALSHINHAAFMLESEAATPEEIREEQYEAAQYEAEEFNL